MKGAGDLQDVPDCAIISVTGIMIQNMKFWQKANFTDG